MSGRTDESPLRDGSGDFYVYALVDPRTDHAFYIGKGKGRRVLDHAALCRAGRHPNPFIARQHAIIAADGHEMAELILSRDLSERQALEMERALIARVGLDRLANRKPGNRDWASRQMAQAQTLLMRMKDPADVPLAKMPMYLWIFDLLYEMANGLRLTPPHITNGMTPDALHALCSPGRPMKGATHHG